MAYVVMDYIVMAIYSHGLYSYGLRTCDDDVAEAQVDIVLHAFEQRRALVVIPFLIVMAYVVIAYVGVAYVVMASTSAGHHTFFLVMAYVSVAYVVMASRSAGHHTCMCTDTCVAMRVDTDLGMCPAPQDSSCHHGQKRHRHVRVIIIIIGGILVSIITIIMMFWC